MSHNFEWIAVTLLLQRKLKRSLLHPPLMLDAELLCMFEQIEFSAEWAIQPSEGIDSVNP